MEGPYAQIRELLEAIAEKERALEQKTTTHTSWKEFENEAEAEANKSEKKLAAAQEEWRICESEKANATAQYERCQQNKSHHSQAELLNKEVADAEAELRAADEHIRSLEGRLHEVSATYKNERERRMMLLNNVKKMIEELNEAVEYKISATMRSDTEAIDAPRCLRALVDISREREAECRRWGRYCEEVAATVDLKRDRAKELQLESDNSITQLKEAKEAEMRTLLSKCEDERQSMVDEIEQLKEVHKQQLEQLRGVKYTTQETIGKIAPLDAKATKPSTVSAEKFLMDKNKDLDHEREALESALREIHYEKNRVALNTRKLQQETDNEVSKHERQMQGITSAITNERQDILDLETENQQLRDLCDSLSAALHTGFRGARLEQ